MLKLTDIERIFESLLQKKVQVVVNGKVIKDGILLLYTIKDYYVTFILKSSEGIKKYYEFPMPFNIELKDNSFILDYKLETLAYNNIDLLYQLKTLSQKKSSKIYNSVIIIHF